MNSYQLLWNLKFSTTHSPQKNELIKCINISFILHCRLKHCLALFAFFPSTPVLITIVSNYFDCVNFNCLKDNCDPIKIPMLLLIQCGQNSPGREFDEAVE